MKTFLKLIGYRKAIVELFLPGHGNTLHGIGTEGTKANNLLYL